MLEGHGEASNLGVSIINLPLSTSTTSTPHPTPFLQREPDLGPRIIDSVMSTIDMMLSLLDEGAVSASLRGVTHAPLPTHKAPTVCIPPTPLPSTALSPPCPTTSTVLSATISDVLGLPAPPVSMAGRAFGGGDGLAVKGSPMNLPPNPFPFSAIHAGAGLCRVVAGLGPALRSGGKRGGT